MQITIRFGASGELTRDVASSTTVGDVLRNSSFKSALGYGDNVQAVIDGVVQTTSSHLTDGDVLTIETKANSKA